MFLINQHLFAVPDVGEDILFDNLMNKATVLGYDLPSTINQNSLNTLIKDMRRIGMIQRLDLFHIYASDLESETDFRLMNIVNPEMIGSQVGVINWSKKGSKGIFTGVSSSVSTKGFIDTGFNPYTGGYNYQLNNASIGGVVYENDQLNDVGQINVIGAALSDTTSNNNGTGLLAGNNTGHRLNQHGYTINSEADMSGTGLKMISRNSNTELIITTQHDLFNRTANSSYIYNASIIVHGRISRVLTGNTNFYSNIGISCAFAGASIPFEMAQNFRQVYNKYLRSIGLIQVA